jgi:hypothetical protein
MFDLYTLGLNTFATTRCLPADAGRSQGGAIVESSNKLCGVWARLSKQLRAPGLDSKPFRYSRAGGRRELTEIPSAGTHGTSSDFLTR